VHSRYSAHVHKSGVIWLKICVSPANYSVYLYCLFWKNKAASLLACSSEVQSQGNNCLE